MEMFMLYLLIEIRQSTPVMNKQTKSEFNKEMPLNINDLKHNYGHKRNILRKLMIAQRKKFIAKKEQVDFNRLKKNLADTSISNFSQVSGFAGNNEEKEKDVNASNNQTDNIK